MSVQKNENRLFVDKSGALLEPAIVKMSPFDMSLEPLRELVTNLGTEGVVDALDEITNLIICVMTDEPYNWKKEYLQKQLYNVHEMRRMFTRLERSSIMEGGKPCK